MKKRTIPYLITFLMVIPGLLLVSSVYAQELKSEKVGFHLNNLPKDTKVPLLNIYMPRLADGSTYKTEVPELNLVGKTTDENGISFFAVNSEVVELGNEGMFNKILPLNPGLNEISIVSVDQFDNRLEKHYYVEFVPPIVSLANRIKEETVFYALIIGIDEYNDKDIPDLDNPIHDATELYTVLTEDYSFDKENISFLKNATRVDIINALDKLAQKITPNDNLLVFYAGHGWWDSNAHIGYWLPSDAQSGSKADWFRNSTLVDYLKEIQARHTLLITDACFGGAIFKTRSAFSDGSKAFEKLYELPSRKAMTSGTLTEVPDESTFIKYLVEQLRANKEMFISSEQLFSSFRLAVINNSDVVPQYGEIKNVGDQGGDFLFIKK